LLPISLTGKKSDLERNIIDSKFDYYVGAPIIQNDAHLKSMIDHESGYIIIDGMAKIRLSDQLPIITEHPKIAEVYHSGESKLNKIWVYKF